MDAGIDKNSFIQQSSAEHLLCVRHWKTKVDKRALVQLLKQGGGT
jgi:hypothetical protein